MNKEIQKLVHELELIGSGKGVRPNGDKQRACAKAAQVIKELYANQESTMDS